MLMQGHTERIVSNMSNFVMVVRWIEWDTFDPACQSQTYWHFEIDNSSLLGTVLFITWWLAASVASIH